MIFPWCPTRKRIHGAQRQITMSQIGVELPGEDSEGGSNIMGHSKKHCHGPQDRRREWPLSSMAKNLDTA
jgi:hypothetical protein